MPVQTLDSAIFDAAPIGLLYSEDRLIRRCNHRFAAIFGYGAEELVGQSLALLYPSPDDFDHTGQQWSRELSLHGVYADERIMRRKGDALFWCRVRGQSMDPSRPLTRAVWSFSDISAERPVVALTRRERQVGMLLVEGLTAKEIARRLEISPRTVHVHKTRLMTRFGVRNSLELVRCLTSGPV
ncbi:PAS domain S-box protein [Pseudooceanicola sediminis]|uniref:PAS domain S-box protein n=1 Tax=Pseudooceanicola sediminis TaxID=2211117 RepID=A0A399IVZ6_9RHOB|nr:PAS and helix-turn-helix domain-containing protein [Pseudooceanicola sediminis]KAA2314961.1 PAS and helix-turn-helix domain-containing protein [Puniceibacterium sp. HSS470]RII37333.1 PAS domain S-box protein [Pseudooceanicola sediminis]|tara:strand:- start:19585 stop:20136 length:552 start_codon:yes stop_codon:yes gene_type:complete